MKLTLSAIRKMLKFFSQTTFLQRLLLLALLGLILTGIAKWYGI